MMEDFLSFIEFLSDCQYHLFYKVKYRIGSYWMLPEGPVEVVGRQFGGSIRVRELRTGRLVYYHADYSITSFNKAKRIRKKDIPLVILANTGA